MSRLKAADLAALLEHDEAHVRHSAAVVVGTLGLADKVIIDGLVRMSLLGPRAQSLVALEALARIGAPVASNALLPLMKSAAREVRTAAAKVVQVAEQAERVARPKKLLGDATRKLSKLIR